MVKEQEACKQKEGRYGGSAATQLASSTRTFMLAMNGWMAAWALNARCPYNRRPCHACVCSFCLVALILARLSDSTCCAGGAARTN